jgi:hypothetical protein
VNVTIKFEQQPLAYNEVLRRTPCIDGREFQILKRLESVLIQLGPYDNSDFIKIEQDNGEVFILVPSREYPGEQECIFSTTEEQP